MMTSYDTWFTGGLANRVFDNLIASGKVAPTILVHRPLSLYEKLGHSGYTFAKFSQWAGFHHWGPQYYEGVIVFSLHIYMAKTVDFGNT
jgi:hypothetical protein